MNSNFHLLADNSSIADGLQLHPSVKLVSITEGGDIVGINHGTINTDNMGHVRTEGTARVEESENVDEGTEGTARSKDGETESTESTEKLEDSEVVEFNQMLNVFEKYKNIILKRSKDTPNYDNLLSDCKNVIRIASKLMYKNDFKYEIKFMSDFIEQFPKVIGKIENNVFDVTDDKIIFIENTHPLTYTNSSRGERNNRVNTTDGWCIAGSAALLAFINELKYNPKISTPVIEQFISNDTDIFMLNSDRKLRYISGSTDIVHVTNKTVESLLLNFDLPCCRVATNSNGDFWISEQCLYALYTKTYYLPKYMENFEQYKNVVKNLDANMFFHGKNEYTKHCSIEFLYKRFVERTDKYKKRGFINIKYVETDKILPWIINRFSYVDHTTVLDNKSDSRHPERKNKH